jgi:hypothetical protein
LAEGEKPEGEKAEGEESKIEGIEEETPAADKKPKKMKINQEYVKDKVKQQLKNLATKNRNKANNNKNKGA